MNELSELSTPALLLDVSVLKKNCLQMQQKAIQHSINLRPHMKTAKSIDVYRMATENGFKGITVSTLAEAEYFANNGVDDIIYAVGMVPSKVAQAARIIAKGCELKLIVDHADLINSLNQQALQHQVKIKLLIEIDCGGRRGGVSPASSELVEIAKLIQAASHLEFSGLITHAGHSYHCRSEDAIVRIAAQERLAIVDSGQHLQKTLGLSCEILSVGSTPTAQYGENFAGLTEMRPGVYMFGDVDQYFIGSCQLEQIALSVLTTVIGHNRRANRLLIDAGGLALSKDVSASEFSKRTGYGWLCNVQGKHLPGYYVDSVHQEHGLVACSIEDEFPFAQFPIGQTLRIMPIHACMTAAAFEAYQLIDETNQLVGQWPRVNHW